MSAVEVFHLFLILSIHIPETRRKNSLFAAAPHKASPAPHASATAPARPLHHHHYKLSCHYVNPAQDSPALKCSLFSNFALASFHACAFSQSSSPQQQASGSTGLERPSGVAAREKLARRSLIVELAVRRSMMGAVWGEVTDCVSMGRRERTGVVVVESQDVIGRPLWGDRVTGAR